MRFLPGPVHIFKKTVVKSVKIQYNQYMLLSKEGGFAEAEFLGKEESKHGC